MSSPLPLEILFPQVGDASFPAAARIVTAVKTVLRRYNKAYGKHAVQISRGTNTFLMMMGCILCGLCSYFSICVVPIRFLFLFSFPSCFVFYFSILLLTLHSTFAVSLFSTPSRASPCSVQATGLMSY